MTEKDVERLERKLEELMDKVVCKEVYKADRQTIDERCLMHSMQIQKLEKLVMRLFVSSFFVLVGVVVQFLIFILGQLS